MTFLVYTNSGLWRKTQIVSAILCAVLSVPAFAQINPKQVALLRWYPANLSATLSLAGPYGMTFDGTNLWIGGRSAPGVVTKLRASDGTMFGSTSVGSAVSQLAFDSANVWAALDSGSVAKIRASDGMLLGSFPVAGVDSARSIVFDGQFIWVGTISGVISKLRIDTGAVVFTTTLGGSFESAVYDGANVWFINYQHGIIELRPSDGVIVATIPFACGRGSVSDGANIWVSNGCNSSVTKFRASDGAILGNYMVGTGPVGVNYDGTNIWVANFSSSTVSKLRASDGAPMGVFPVSESPSFIVFDGANTWVSSLFADTLSKM
ncbi:MAG TPA: hypothetical protein VNW47_16400 [Terriglobales bacterium]|nr:hypothetical protein [Terriglobales bacterium]